MPASSASASRVSSSQGKGQPGTLTLFSEAPAGPSSATGASSDVDASSGAGEAAEDTEGTEGTASTEPGGGSGSGGGEAEGFLARVAGAEAPEREPLLDERDQSTVASARHEAKRRLGEIECIRARLEEMEEAGNEVAAAFLSDSDRDLSKRRERAIKECYREIVGALNRRYNTRLEPRPVFKRAYPTSTRGYRRNEQQLQLLEIPAIEEAIDEAVDTGDLTEAGRRATVERFQGEMSSWKDPRVRKRLVSLPAYVCFDEYSQETKFDYTCRDAVPALAGALWLFERNAAEAPRGFLSALRGAHTVIPTNEKLRLEEITSGQMSSFEKVKAVKLHKNGTLKIYFSEPEHTRAFAEMFGLS